MNKPVRSIQTTSALDKVTTQAPEPEVIVVQQEQVANKEAEVKVTDTEAAIQDPVKETIAQEAPVDKVVAAAPIESDGVQLSVFENRVAWIEKNGSDHEKHALVVLQNYVRVNQTSVDLDAIAVEQQRLWRLFEYIHNQPKEFQKLFGLVIEFAREYRKTVFNLALFFRAQASMNLSADSLQAFNNLRTLVLNTADTKDKRKVKALIDIRKIVEHDSIPEHVRGLYVAFYE